MTSEQLDNIFREHECVLSLLHYGEDDKGISREHYPHIINDILNLLKDGGTPATSAEIAANRGAEEYVDAQFVERAATIVSDNNKEVQKQIDAQFIKKVMDILNNQNGETQK